MSYILDTLHTASLTYISSLSVQDCLINSKLINLECFALFGYKADEGEIGANVETFTRSVEYLLKEAMPFLGLEW